MIRCVRLGARAQGERGFSLVELIVTVALFGVVVAVMGPVLTSSMAAGREVDNESRALDQVRVAVARIDRELRSACEVSAPALGSSGSELTFRTETGNSGSYAVTYRIVGGQLIREQGSSSVPIADGLVVTSQEFRHEQNAVASRAQIAVELQVRFEQDNSPRQLSTLISGRNTWSACT